VGTGGAEKDTVYDDKITKELIKDKLIEDNGDNGDSKNIPIEYIIDENLSTNGYLICETRSGGLTCSFVDVGPGDEKVLQNGGKRLSRKKKQTHKHIAKKKLTKKKL